MPFTQYEADKYLNERLGSTAVAAKLTNVYYGLINGDPDAGGVEITGAGYARVAIPCNDTNWSAPATDGTFRYKANLLAVTFGNPTGDWNAADPITHFGIWDAPSGGNRMYDGLLPTPRTIVGGDDPALAPPGSIRIRLAF
jgi:hypothetical protein